MNDGEPCRVIEGVSFACFIRAADRAADGAVVVRLEYGKFRHLFSSDIDKRDEAILVVKNGDLSQHGQDRAAPRQRDGESARIHRRRSNRNWRSFRRAREPRRSEARRGRRAISPSRRRGAEHLRRRRDHLETDGNTASLYRIQERQKGD